MLTLRQSVFAVIAAGISVATADTTISSQCEGTLASLVLSSDGTCLNAQALIGVLTASSDSSLVSPINNWLTGMCSQAACSNATLATVTSDLTSGCSTELESLGFGNVTAAELTTLVQSMYPTIRQMACLEDTSNNTLCVTEMLTGIQTAQGTPVTESSLETLLQEFMGTSSATLPNSVTCSDCSKEMYIVANQGLPGLLDASDLSQTCGASFADGSSPSDVNQTANTATESTSSDSSTSTSKSGDLPAFGLSAAGITVSTLLTALFALLG